MLDSSNSSFRSAYDIVVREGNLHDAIVKDNFKVSADSKIEIGLLSSDGSVRNLDNDGNAIIENDTLKFISVDSTDLNKKLYEIHIDINKNSTSGDYTSLLTTDCKLVVKVIFDKTKDKFYVTDVDSNLAKTKSELASYLITQIDSHKSNLTNTVQKGLSDTFVKQIDKIYGEKLFVKNTRSLSVTAGVNAYKMVEVDSNQTNVNKLVIYSGYNRFTKQLTNQEMSDELVQRIATSGQLVSDFTINTLKGYRVSAQSSTGNSIVIDDPSSFQAIVSPGYANANNKNTISLSKLMELHKENEDFISDPHVLEEYSNCIIYVDRTPYFIVGIGTTPDYSYPIIDSSNPIVDVDTQAILFVNKRGYERAFDAWRTNPQENYISLRKKPSTSNDEWKLIKSEIEIIAREGSTKNVSVHTDESIPISYWPDNISIVTDAFDMNDQILLVQERVAFLRSVQKTVGVLSSTTTSLLIIFVGTIVLLIFGSIVTNDRKALATLMSLGFSRSKIALSTSSAALSLGIATMLFGYWLGFGAQYLFIRQFDSFWTIPTYGYPFSISSMLVSGLFPFMIMFLAIFSITLFTLRHPLYAMVTGEIVKKGNWSAKFFGKLKRFPIHLKYSMGLMFKNGGKLLMTGLTMTIAMLSLMIGFSTMGKANKAYAKTLEQYDYAYQVNLYSPTVEGGNYTRLNYGVDQENSHPQVKNIFTSEDATINDTYDPITITDTTLPHWHIPGVNDAGYGVASQAAQDSNIDKAAKYLDNKLQVKLLLDKSIAGLNPWEVAMRLMPDNQLNTADEDYSVFKKIIESDKSLSAVSNWEALQKVIQQKNNDYIPYIISYRNVIMDKADETYTYIEGDLRKNNTSSNYRILGLSSTNTMVKIDMNKINSMKIENNVIPVVVNKFIKEYKTLEKGKIYPINVLNNVKRNLKTEININYSIKVVDVVEGYDNYGFYTSQDVANKVIGLSNNGFNGVFTRKEKSPILSTMPLYSPSGLYLGTDTIIGDWETTVLQNILNNPNIWNYGSSITKDVGEFISTYSRTPYVSSVSEVYWTQMTKVAFQNTVELSSKIILVVEIVSIILSIIFTTIVSSLILSSNKKRIATLSTLGYQKKTILKIYLNTYALPSMISVVISTLLSIGILRLLRLFIMSFGKILIPFSLVWWAPIVAISMVSLIYILATTISIYKMNCDEMLIAFKEG